MAKYYTQEKAKYGGVTGTIQPFTIKLPDVNLPTEADWIKYVPAGFLRCDGSIYKASLFPVLANVIGVGSQCKFARTELQADEFQLPDLGSKYIRASNSSGQYLNTNLNQDNTISKIGVETQVQSLIGDSTEISYAGNMKVLGVPNIAFGGNPFYRTATGYTTNAALTEQNFQSHGHSADVGVFTYLAKWKDSNFITGGGSGGNDGQTEGSNNLVQIDPPDDAPATITHNHQITLPSSSDLRANNQFKYSVIEQDIPAESLRSTVTVTTENVTKLDEAISPYILVEYIIKI